MYNSDSHFLLAGITSVKGVSGPMRLYVGSLHFNITEEMLKGIFEPFGKVRPLYIYFVLVD